MCFVDSDSSKVGSFIDELPIKTLQSIIDEFGLLNLLIYVTPMPPVKFEIMDYLMQKHKITVEKIVNYQPYTWKKSCRSIMNNQITLGSNLVALCCNIDDNVIPPVLNYENLTPEKVYTQFYRMRDTAIASINSGGKICANCKDIIEGRFAAENDGHIDAVAFGGGGICNFRCIYCGFTQSALHGKLSKNDCQHILAKLCAIIDEFRKNGKIDKYTRVTIANGEPILNPHLEELLKMFCDNKVSIYTNASVLSPVICKKMRDRNIDLLVSVDAGTPETFKYVKGVDCFNKVVKNIITYAENGIVNLKYILIPNINTDDKNIEGFLSLAEKIKSKVVLSKDLRGEEAWNDNIHSIINAAGKFVRGARKRGLVYDLINFNDEIQMIIMGEKTN